VSLSAASERCDELRRRLPALSEDLRALQELCAADVPSALNKMRYITEKALHQLCLARGVLWGQAEPTLERMIGPLVSARCLPGNIAIHVRTIQGNASPGSHYQASALTASHVGIARSALLEFLEWFAASANREAAPKP
jgi:hypothetical protein